MILTAPKSVRRARLDREAAVQAYSCGVIRASMDSAPKLLPPSLTRLINTAPTQAHRKYTVDVKVHMLKKGEYPCIPGWHCDMVPRDLAGRLDYAMNDPDETDILLWVSGAPVPTFLAGPLETARGIREHSHLKFAIEPEEPVLFDIEPETWYRFRSDTPHFGNPATEDCWRVFIRLVSAPGYTPLPYDQQARRHCQVYLDARNFSW